MVIHMRLSRLVLPLLILLGLAATAVAPAPAGAKPNPYTAAGVCGPGFSPIDRHPLIDPNNAKLLAEVVLTYNGATGQNCVVTLKRYRVGVARKYDDWLMAEVYTRPLTVPSNLSTDKGDFRFFAGPVYVTARSKCVQWGGQADLIFPANHSPRGTYHSAFRSGWTHCG
jgi:hypothetical protein